MTKRYTTYLLNDHETTSSCDVAYLMQHICDMKTKNKTIWVNKISLKQLRALIEAGYKVGIVK